MNPNHGTHARDTCCHGRARYRRFNSAEKTLGKRGKPFVDGLWRVEENLCSKEARCEKEDRGHVSATSARGTREGGKSTDHVSRREEEQVREGGADSEREGRKGREGRAVASRLF